MTEWNKQLAEILRKIHNVGRYDDSRYAEEDISKMVKDALFAITALKDAEVERVIEKEIGAWFGFFNDEGRESKDVLEGFRRNRLAEMHINKLKAKGESE